MYSVETFDYDGYQRTVEDPIGIKFSNHYGDGGSGYGYLKFDLKRNIGVRYPDIGFGYRVKVRKGLKIIYDGMIREIGEATKEGVGTISVSAVGFVIAAEDAPEILRNFCNTDLSKWIVPGQIPGNLFRPDQFSTSSQGGGLVLNATTQSVAALAYTELAFEFWPGEIAERIKCDVFVNLGKGVAFDADVDYGVIFEGAVSSIDDPNKYVYYKDASGDGSIATGMTLYNVTQDLSNVITAIDTSLTRITVTTSPAAWATDDEIYIRDPLFSATISSIASQVITYGSDTGENNISTSNPLINSTQGETVEIDSFDVSANTVTVLGDISGWGATDAISIAVVSISSSNYLFYKNNTDETKIVAGMSVFDLTQGLSSTVDTVDTSLNRIKLTSSPSSWSTDDQMYIPGPLFSASISSIAGSVITYTADIGENNISTSYQLVNLTKKDSSGISSNDTGADTITASDDISSWEENDTIIIAAPLFQATVSAISTTQITFTGEAGLRIVNSDTGWILHNITKDEVATVASWTAPDKLDVTVAGEISTWTGDTIYIYTPYTVSLVDSNDVMLWPTSDWRLGAVIGLTVGINATTTGSPTSFRIIFQSYIAGSGDESSFAKLENIKVYSTEDSVTMETISKAMLTDLATLGIDSSEDNIAAITKVIEPSVFEFKDIKEVLGETAKYGSQSGNRIAWGLRPDDRRRFFVEEFPTDIGYTLIREGGNSDVEVTADLGESVQRLRGVYTNALGEQVIMAWEEDTAAYYGGYYISRTETLSNIDNDTDAQSYLQLILGEDAAPPISSSYTVRGDAIRDIRGNVIPFDEVIATGSYIEVEDFRAAITGSQVSDLSANWVRDRLVAVEIDIDAESVKLIPGKARKTFEVYMAELSRIAKI